MLRPALLGALAAVVLSGAPASAAGTIDRTGTTLRITETSAALRIDVAEAASTITISLNPGTVLTPQTGSDCTLAAAVVTCADADEIELVDVTSGGTQDSVDLNAFSKSLTWDAGAGVDSLVVIFGAVVTGRLLFEGQLGDDSFQGGAAADRFDGGEGDDSIFVSPGGDEIRGGSGFDRLTAPDERVLDVSLDGVADDSLGDGAAANVHADVEDVFSRFGVLGDVLVGSAADNQLFTAGGGDVLVGGGGFDVLRAGGGSDQLFARDGLAEGVDCGDGTDFAEVDDVDVTIDCETVAASADARPDADATACASRAIATTASPASGPARPRRSTTGSTRTATGRTPSISTAIATACRDRRTATTTARASGRAPARSPATGSTRTATGDGRRSPALPRRWACAPTRSRRTSSSRACGSPGWSPDSGSR